MKHEAPADALEQAAQSDERQLALWLASYDVALKNGSGPAPAIDAMSLDAESRQRLERARTCLNWLYLASRHDRRTSDVGLDDTKPESENLIHDAHTVIARQEAELLNLAIREIRLRKELGESPHLSQYEHLFPECGERLRGALAELANNPANSRPPSGSLELPVVPGYEITREIGRGGMGVVYEAWQTKLKRRVALKTIKVGVMSGVRAYQRFISEAEAIARLRHPGIVQIYDVGEFSAGPDGSKFPYFALEFVEGGSLDRRLAESMFSVRDSAEMVEMLARAVHTAHQAGIIHRDLKPANILLPKVENRAPREGDPDTATLSHLNPKITDFGLAKNLDDEADQTASGMIVGTPSYMAPEQAKGRGLKVLPAVDVYALGAILYELLTGRPPFKAASPLETLMLVMHEEPVPPSQLQPGLPRDLEVICLKCLEKDPSTRYQSAWELAEELRRFQAGEPIHARPAGTGERVLRWCARKPVAAALVLVSAIAALAVPVAVTGSVFNVKLNQTLAETRLARQRESEAARKAEEFHYFHRISLASAEWRDSDIQRMEQLLEQCPPNLRQWEWHYLKRLCRPKVQTLQHSGTMLCAAVSNDGKWIAAAGEDRIAAIWENSTGRRVHTLKGHTGSIYGASFSPDGQLLATASSDLTVKLWNVADGKEVRVLTGHTNGVRAVVFDPHGEWVAAAGKDGQILIWDPHTGKLLRTLQGVVSHHCCLAVSADGKQLAYGVSAQIFIWDPTTGELLRTLQGSNVARSVTFSPNGERLMVGLDNGDILALETRTDTVVFILRGHAGAAYRVVYSIDGKRIASGSEDSTVKIWDAETGKVIDQLQGHSGRVYGVVFHPNGKRLITAGTDKVVKLWDSISSNEALIFTAHPNTRTAGWSHDSERVVTGGVEPFAKIWDAKTGELLHAIRTDEEMLNSVAFSPDGKWIAVAGESGAIQIWNAHSRELVHSLPGHKGSPALLAVFSRDSLRLVTGGHDKTARVWDVARGAEILCYQEHQHDVQALAFSPNGRHIVSSGEDKSVRIWDASTGETIHSFAQDVRVIRAVVWSPDSRRIAIGLSTGVIAIFDMSARAIVQQLEGHSHGIKGLAWSPDGKRLATASSDRTIVIWEMTEGQQALTLRGFADDVTSVSWSPDGNCLLAPCRDGTVRIWDGTPLPASADLAQGE